ncbi:heavy-metal-associated domain-containing protein [Flavihumibacter rivuli]|uniref:heavy-metal-associated domain-containing protein n=1 Tax=Flavihumibacter rivuli TaxID=2838156 RepID=UPI001BDEA517|nr:heavy-metal-associated domain-containing protein [Flavihumibacter rivuli]ULQ57172.1 heavy-metal-associated domain-containing protein [Flavihumibacter rivuli]
MKKIVVLIAILVMGVGAYANFTKATLQASGLTCAMCTKAINKSLEKLPFVAAVTVDIKTSSFGINFKEGVPVDIDAVRKAVEDAGFSVAKLQLTGKFNQVAVKNDAHFTIDGKVYHFLAVKSQVLDGEQTITVVDKNFLTAKEFKKYSGATKMACVQTGKAGACCQKDGIAAETRIFHVTI